MRPGLTSCWLSLWLTLCLQLGYAQEDAVAPKTGTLQATESANEQEQAVGGDSSEVDENPTSMAIEQVAPSVGEDPTMVVPKESSDSNSPLGFLTRGADARPAAPDVFLLPDATGKLRKILGFQYEDFFNAWKRDANQLASRPPRYVLDHWSLTGDAGDSLAKLHLEFEITVQSSGWVEIPIQLPELIVQNIVIQEQRGGESLIFDKDQHGYVLWLSGEGSTQRKLILDGLARLSSSAGSKSIELHLPRASTNSFLMRVSAAASDLQSSKQLALETVRNTDDMTEVRLLGQANPFRLAWKIEKEPNQAASLPLQVEEETTIQIDRRLASYETTLRIDNNERPLQQVRVRLPNRAKLKFADLPSDYDVKQIRSSSTGDQHEEILVSLPEPSLEPWSINLFAEAPIESFGDAAECRLEGFQVLEAFDQSGTVTLEVDDQLLAYFDLYDEVEQIPIEETSVASDGRSILGNFRYTRFPWQIVVFSSPRQRRVSVQPRYELNIDADEARLDVQYDYQLTGAQIFSMRIALNGWERTDAPIESGGTIDPNSVVERRDGRLSLGLVDPSTPQLSLKLSFRKDIQLGENTFYFPEPMEAFMVDGELRVGSNDSMLLASRFEECEGLSILPVEDDDLLDFGESETLNAAKQIRLRTFLPQPKYVTEISRREQEVSVAQATEVEIDRSNTRVLQRFDYVAKYSAVSQLTLRLPDRLWQNSSLKVTHDGEELPLGLVNAVDGAGDAGANDAEDALQSVIVSLPRPIQDEIPLELTYQIANPPLSVDELEAITLPLASPLDQLLRHDVEVRGMQSVLVSANQASEIEEWNAISSEGLAENSAGALNLSANAKTSSLSFFAKLTSAEEMELATMERAWFQTWITPNQRQERAVFRFHTAGVKVFVQMPFQLDGTEMEVLLDGNPWAYEMLDDNRVLVSLRSPDPQIGYTLELRYHDRAGLPSVGALQTDLPQLECRVSSAPIYWHLVLPQRWQLASAPEQLIPDYWLGWRNFRWGRQPTLSQADLEQHTNAKSEMAPPPLSSQYVFRAFELPSEIEFVVIRQLWVFLACAVGVFGLGLLCIYTPIARKGYFWLGLSLSLLAGGLRYPEFTILLIELILAGGLMTLISLVLRRALNQAEEPSSTEINIRLEPSEFTQPWPEQVRVGGGFTESTTELKTGGPMP